MAMAPRCVCSSTCRPQQVDDNNSDRLLSSICYQPAYTTRARVLVTDELVTRVAMQKARDLRTSKAAMGGLDPTVRMVSFGTE